MKVAVAADLHLTTRQKHSDRFAAFENILRSLVSLDISSLILAGDTFDESGRNYADFENICRRPEFRCIDILMLPGNHDFDLSEAALPAENVSVITDAEIREFESGALQFLLLPYRADRTMGEDIAAVSGRLRSGRWVLIGHGDWTGGLHDRNPLEPGVYMPLTRVDLDKFRPKNVILGHIHKPMDGDVVHYVGSPCGLDIRETGRRRFVTIDTSTGFIEPHVVETEFIYFNESFVVLPVEDEPAFVREQIEHRIAAWNISPEERTRVRVQVRLSGYSVDQRVLLKTIRDCFQGFRFYRDGEPILTDVYLADDANKAEVARRVSAAVNQFAFANSELQPQAQDILLSALQTIYGD